MLNPSQYDEFTRLEPSNEITYANILYGLVDLSQRDEGVVENFFDEECCVDFVRPLFQIGQPVTPWLSSRLNNSSQIISKKIIRSFSSVQVTGWRSLITSKGFYSSEKNYIAGNHEKIFSSKNEGYGRVDQRVYIPFPRNTFNFSGVGLFLTYLEPGNHGSFIFRALPKLIFFIESGLKIDYIVSPDVSQSLRDTLRCLGLGEIRLISCKQAIGQIFEKLYVVDDFEEEGVLCSSTMRRIWEMILPTGNPLSFRKKIYVSRKLNYGFRPKYRPLINEDEVERLLVKKGFEILYPESLSFSQQMVEFGSAGLIVGPSGSGMLNAVFAGAGTFVIDLESFTYTIAQHAKVYSSSMKNYGFVFGKYEEQTGFEPLRPWSVSIDDVDAAVEQASDFLGSQFT